VLFAQAHVSTLGQPLVYAAESTLCLQKKLQDVIEREEREGRPVNREETPEERRQRQQFQTRMDIEDCDIIIQGSNTTRLSRKQVTQKFQFLSHIYELLRAKMEGQQNGGCKQPN
jgi:hypothetical protein